MQVLKGCIFNLPKTRTMRLDDFEEMQLKVCCVTLHESSAGYASWVHLSLLHFLSPFATPHLDFFLDSSSAGLHVEMVASFMHVECCQMVHVRKNITGK